MWRFLVFWLNHQSAGSFIENVVSPNLAPEQGLFAGMVLAVTFGQQHSPNWPRVPFGPPKPPRPPTIEFVSRGLPQKRSVSCRSAFATPKEVQSKKVTRHCPFRMILSCAPARPFIQRFTTRNMLLIMLLIMLLTMRTPLLKADSDSAALVQTSAP